MRAPAATGLSGIGQAAQNNTDNEASIISAAANLKHVEKCREELKMLNIKSEVMREELNEAQVKHESAKQGMKAKEQSLNILSGEKDDALERLRKVQREI